MPTLRFLRQTHDLSVELARPLTLEGLNAQRRAALLLYGAIVELAGAFTLLCEQGSWVGAPSVARSCLEAALDFQNALDQPDYINRLEATCLWEHLKRLRAARDQNNNPYFADIRQGANVDQLIANEERRLDELTQAGIRRLQIQERFGLARAQDMYRSIYSLLCDESHNALVKLYARQFEGGRLQFALYREQTVADNLAIIDLVAGVLSLATQRIHELLQTPNVEQAREPLRQLATIRAAYSL